MITAPASTSPVQQARGRGQVGRGLPRGRGQSGGAPSRFYAFLARPEAVASDAVITRIISIFCRDALVLFDIGSSHSYVSSLLDPYLDVSRESLDILVYVSTPMGDSVVVDWVDRSCVGGYETRADLLLLDMIDLEVILGIDRLSLYHAILDCHAKTVSLVMPRLEWRGLSSSTSCQVISFLNARYMVEKGCLAYLDFVQDTVLETPTINSVPVVRDFFDVFPAELLGMLLNHGIDFDIDLAPDT
ncbi:uncharacterized protein [Nicotiana tomentosiformis]|uniref:uncharacterized protein n=1 Tax=Nicotiana tomentosiformis TaxID=4098 RepID=UPI00388C9717